MQAQAVASSPTRTPTTSIAESPATRAEIQLLELSIEESQRNLRAANMEILRLRVCTFLFRIIDEFSLLMS